MPEPLNYIRESLIIGEKCQERFLPLTAPAGAALRQAGVALGGLSDLRGDYSLCRLDFHYHVLLWTLQGQGECQIRDTHLWLRPGDRLVVPAGTPYACRLAAPEWRIAWLHLRPPGPHDAAVGRDWRLEPVGDGGDQVATAMDGLLTEAAAPESPVAACYVDLLVALLVRSLGPRPSAADREQRERLDAIWRDVEADPAANWRISELAAAANLSAAQFHRVCRRHYGRGPQEQLTHLRMQRAQALLRSTTWPLKQIAPRLGYSNSFAFSTAFKRYCGLSPRDWRQG